MNVMLAAGGHQWTVIPVEEHNTYMAALEDAGVRQNIATDNKDVMRPVKLERLQLLPTNDNNPEALQDRIGSGGRI